MAHFSGIPVRLVDTAGIHETRGVIERLGIERSLQTISNADLSVVLIDGAPDRSEDEQELIARAREQGRFLVVANKCDLPGFRPARLRAANLELQGGWQENLPAGCRACRDSARAVDARSVLRSATD